MTGITFRALAVFLAAAVVWPVSAEEPVRTSSVDAAHGIFAAADSNESANRTREAFNYPFFHLTKRGRLEIFATHRETFADYDLDMLQGELESWNVVAEPASAHDQVHRIVVFRRSFRETNAVRNRLGYVVFTGQDDKWGVQFAADIKDSDRAFGAIRDARLVLARFFDAWNASDNDAIHAQINFPHVFLVREGRAAIAHGPEELMTDFEAMREGEGWEKSEYRDFEVLFADDSKVIAKLTFTRHHADGAVYRTVPVVWVFTNQDGHWGLQMRMILPSI